MLQAEGQLAVCVNDVDGDGVGRCGGLVVVMVISTIFKVTILALRAQTLPLGCSHRQRGGGGGGESQVTPLPVSRGAEAE